MKGTALKGKTLDGILFDGTFEHAVEIGKFLKYGFTIENKTFPARIILNEGKTKIEAGDFVVLDGEPLTKRIIKAHEVTAYFDEVKPVKPVKPEPVRTWAFKLGRLVKYITP